MRTRRFETMSVAELKTAFDEFNKRDKQFAEDLKKLIATANEILSKYSNTAEAGVEHYVIPPTSQQYMNMSWRDKILNILKEQGKLTSGEIITFINTGDVKKTRKIVYPKLTELKKDKLILKDEFGKFSYVRGLEGDESLQLELK